MNIIDVNNLPPEDEMEWQENTIIGLALRMRVYKDSLGEMIRTHSYYQLGRHLPTGQWIILPDCLFVDLIKNRALNHVMNQNLKINGQLN